MLKTDKTIPVYKAINKSGEVTYGTPIFDVSEIDIYNKYDDLNPCLLRNKLKTPEDDFKEELEPVYLFFSRVFDSKKELYPVVELVSYMSIRKCTNIVYSNKENTEGFLENCMCVGDVVKIKSKDITLIADVCSDTEYGVILKCMSFLSDNKRNIESFIKNLLLPEQDLEDLIKETNASLEKISDVYKHGTISNIFDLRDTNGERSYSFRLSEDSISATRFDITGENTRVLLSSTSNVDEVIQSFLDIYLTQ